MKNTGKYNVYHGVVAVGRWVLFAVVAFLILFPVYWIFISSITPSGELFKTPIDYLPDHPTLESYKFLIQNVGLLSKIGNTVLIVGITLVISTVLWLPMASQDLTQREFLLHLRLFWLPC